MQHQNADQVTNHFRFQSPAERRIAMMKHLFRALLVFFGLASTAMAQPTGNMLGRVLMVQSPYDRGTIFMLDVDQREYWITAKHILTGAKHPPYGTIPSKSVSLHILNPGVFSQAARCSLEQATN
jgi:hypothetical protein